MNTLRVPYEAHTSVVGFASKGSACLREAASAKAGPTKHAEEPRLRAVTHSGVQALNLAWYRAGTGFSPWGLHLFRWELGSAGYYKNDTRNST
jgi:hypothetical protein